MKRKTFVTFPYPYMNGRLHLGHAYTLSKAVFYAEFRRLNGDDVLFPFAFHGTGMPIVASAANLKHELEHGNTGICSQSLMQMGIKQDDLHMFTNPEFWLEYFPKEAKKDLIKFGANADFSRSFITTSLNSHYDLFIRWQFRKLIAKGFITKGTRYVIYSIKDQQPCADHDRVSSCEGIEPKLFNTAIVTVDDLNFVITYEPSTESSVVSSADTVYYDPKAEYQSFKHQGKQYVARKFAVLNLQHQLENITDITEFNQIPSHFVASSTAISGTGFRFGTSNDITKLYPKWHPYYEPEREVISRSGDVCITALTEQWFINYGDQQMKEKVNEFIKTKFFCEQSVKNQLLNSSNWLNEWPCSRNFGLGTKLQGTNYVIDSLSDSTIYMAYYTIAHIINEIPVDLLEDDTVWDYIFMKPSTASSTETHSIFGQYQKHIDEMQRQFRYWYPVDLRVSGKDLVPNHLTMCLYNHMMVWDDFNICPLSYCINGYLMLNGKKMSKSEGNFMTLDEAVQKYGSDIVRISLCEKEGTEDGDFRDNIAVSYAAKLADEKKGIINMVSSAVESHAESHAETNLWDDTFSDELDMIMINTHYNYTNYKFRSVVYEGFHRIISIRDKYITTANKVSRVNHKLILKSIEYQLLILYPICPNWVSEMWALIDHKVKISHSWNNCTLPENYNKNKFHRDTLEYIAYGIGNRNKVTVELITDFTETEKKLVSLVASYLKSCPVDQDTRENWNAFIAKTFDKTNIGKYAKFSTYVKSSIAQYGTEWLALIKEDQSYIIKLLPLLLPTVDIKFMISNSDTKYEFKYGPVRPVVS